MKDKENKIPDWKQWILVYGMIKASQDLMNKKPSVMDWNYPIRYSLSISYQTIVTPVTIGLVISTLEKFLKQ